MGRMSDKKHHARRLGKHERALLKNPHYGHHWRIAANVGGGEIAYEVYAQRKKRRKVCAYLDRLIEAHLGGEPTILKSGTVIKRPLYKITVNYPAIFNPKPEEI